MEVEGEKSWNNYSYFL